MRLALPVWDGRVSPVLDEANRLLVLEDGAGNGASRVEVRITSAGLFEKAGKIIEQHPDVLICGAISGQLQAMLMAAGIEVWPHICGSVQEVLSAYEAGDLYRSSFVMPGCRGLARRNRRGRQGQGRGRCGRGRHRR